VRASREPPRIGSDAAAVVDVLLIVTTVAVAIVAGLVAGGSLRDFPTVRLRALWLALPGVALQYVVVRGSLAFPLLLASFACLLAFAGVNVRAPGFALILIGLALNTVVIAANRGMPVSREALVASGQGSTAKELTADTDGQKHFLANDGTVLLPLGDVIAIPEPIGQAVSIGDIFVHAGIAWFIVMAVRKPRTAEAPAHA
jgi:hypothetical protein